MGTVAPIRALHAMRNIGHGDPLKNTSPYFGVSNTKAAKWGAHVYVPLCRTKPEAEWCADGKCLCKRKGNLKWFGQAHGKEYRLPKAAEGPKLHLPVLGHVF